MSRDEQDTMRAIRRMELHMADILVTLQDLSEAIKLLAVKRDLSEAVQLIVVDEESRGEED